MLSDWLNREHEPILLYRAVEAIGLLQSSYFNWITFIKIIFCTPFVICEKNRKQNNFFEKKNVSNLLSFFLTMFLFSCFNRLIVFPT